MPLPGLQKLHGKQAQHGGGGSAPAAAHGHTSASSAAALHLPAIRSASGSVAAANRNRSNTGTGGGGSRLTIGRHLFDGRSGSKGRSARSVVSDTASEAPSNLTPRSQRSHSGFHGARSPSPEFDTSRADGGASPKESYALASNVSRAVSPGGDSNYYGEGYDTARSRTTIDSVRLKDLEPFSVAYVYAKHRRRCRTTTPNGSVPRARTPEPDPSMLKLQQMADQLGILSDEQRDQLREKLQAKTVVDNSFDEEFDSRLKAVNRRNRDDSLKAAQAVRDGLLAQLLEKSERRVEQHDMRTAEIKEMLKHVQAAKRLAQLMQVIKLWYGIIAAARFSLILQEKLQSAKSIQTLKRTMLPMIIRKKHVLQRLWARRRFTASRMEENPKPTPAMIRSMQGHFFEGWSDAELNTLICYSTPVSFHKGEYIMFEGDYDRVMYLITRGTVEVQIRDKKIAEKRRRREFAAATFEVMAPAYVGEFALLCKEPRSASIACTTDVDTWVVSSKDFHSVVDHLSPAIAKKQQDATDERRRANLRKYFSLRPENIRRSKIFADWDTQLLRELSSVLEPIVLRTGDRLYREGDYEPALYLVADGRVKLTKPSEPGEPPMEVGPGDVLGAFETFFMQERRSHTAICKSNCDVWRLTRQQLLDLGMSDPAALVRSKQVVQETKAAEMYKIPKSPPYALQDPYLSFVLPSVHIQTLWSIAQPRVIGAGEHLSIEGDEAKSIYFVTLGSFFITHLAPESRRFDDKAIISPIKGGVYTGMHYTNDNLKALFPSSVFCEIPKAGGSNLLKPRRSFRGSINLGSSFNLNASQMKAANEEGVVGVCLGAFEYATRQAQWSATYRCASMCEVYVVDRQELESRLPPNLTQIHRTSTALYRTIIEAHLAHNPASLLQLPLNQKITGVYAALKAQEKSQEKAAGGGKKDSAHRSGKGGRSQSGLP